MSDSIMRDHKLVKLLNRFLDENKKIMANQTFVDSLKFYGNAGCSLDRERLRIEIDNMQQQAATTLKHIFKYIDRYVERKVLEERAKQPLKVNKIDEDTVYYLNPINNNVGTERELISIIKQELRLINPLIMFLPNISIEGSFYSTDQFDVTLEFSHDCNLPNNNNYVAWTKFQENFRSVPGSNVIPINVTRLAARLADRINKFVFQHASK